MKKRLFLRRTLSSFLFFLLLICLLIPVSFAESEEAEELDAQACYEEGLRYLNTGDVKDYAAGMALIVKAATAGSAKAMVEVGQFYTAGLGKIITPEMDEADTPDVALSWYVKGAEAGEPKLAGSALSSAAFTYFLGSEDGSVQENDAAALAYFQKAAEYGDTDAINMMVSFYTYGFGVPQDPDKALELSSSLADRGNKDALYTIEDNAYAYYAGTKDGIDINFATSFKYYEKLTEYGNERAMYNVGLLYEFGLGVSRDHEKAVEWLTKALDAGYEPAAAKLEELSAKQ